MQPVLTACATALVRSAFETHKEFEDDRLVLGHEQQKQTLLAVCDQVRAAAAIWPLAGAAEI